MIGGIYISNIRFKKIKLCLTSLTFLIIPFFVLTSCIKQSDSIYISEVIDGDTFQDSENIRYRLLGVDTPESFDSSNNFLPTKGLQKFYASKATNLSSQEILHKNVVIKKWKKDSYDRTVTRINYKWNDLAKILLKNGLARIKYISPIEKDFFYYPDVDYYNQLLEIEQYAKINKIGIWKLTLEEQKIVFSK